MPKGVVEPHRVGGPSELDLLCCFCVLPDCISLMRQPIRVKRGCLRWRAQAVLRDPAGVLGAVEGLAGEDGWCDAGLCEIARAAGEHERVLSWVRRELARREEIVCHTVVRDGRPVMRIRLN